MSELTTALIGAVAGAIGSIPGALLTHYITNRREGRLNRIRRDRLRVLLDDPRWQWRKMNTLCDSIGCSEATTARLLLEIGAVRSTCERDLWSLRPDG